MKPRRALLAAAVALALTAASVVAARAVLRYAEETARPLDAYPAFGDDEADDPPAREVNENTRRNR